MSPRALSLTIILGIVAISSAVGILAGRKHRLNLEEWAVAGRGFGVLFVWLLMAGEIFTTFSLLGISGWVYTKGGPTLYTLAYLTLSQVIAFFLAPAIWELGHRHGLQTLADFFAQRFGSKLLAAFVALAGIFFLIIYLQLQLTGLGIIVGVASFEGIGRTPAMVAAAVLVAGFVFTSGVRGVAWVSVIKDFLLVLAAVVVGIGMPYIHFGGIGPMFAALARAKPGHLVMPGTTANLGHSWYISSVLLSSLTLGWPHTFGSVFTAKSADVVRRNTIVLPLYVLTLGLIVFGGCAAILIVPHLPNGDLALLTAVRATFPPGFLGVLGGAGALTAMVPSAILILAASTLFAKNIYRPFFAPSLTDQQVARLARVVVVLTTAIALGLALKSSATLVALLLAAYAGTGQFFPGIVFGLCWKRATKAGIFAGMAAGIALAGFLILTHRDPIFGLNAGFIAVLVNFAFAIAVSYLTRPQQSGFE
jgi:SSS family solute:Na+ symporter